MAETLKEKTEKGLFWGAMNSGTTQVLNLVIGIVLARCLTQEDYGIVGVLSIFTAIAGNLQSSGFTQGLINMKQPTDRDYNAVFSFNVLMSITLYVILFFCAPLIAEFFHQPCLVGVSRFVFLTFLIASLGIAHGGYLTKNMMNRELAIIGALALIVSGSVGIILAVIYRNYWALAWQQVTYITVINLGRYYFVRNWRPRLTLDFGPVKGMFRFSVKILITNIINTLSSQILTPIFGHIFPIRQVGNYSQAYKWDMMANSLVSNTVGQIAQAVMVEGKNEEESMDMMPDERERRIGERQLRIFRKMLRFTCFLAMPLMFGLSLVSREFISISIGEKWLDCVPLLQVLCISGAFVPVYTMYQNLAISHGRSDVYMWLNIFQIIFQIAIIFVFSKQGMFIMVCAYSAFLILWILPWHFFAGRLIHYRWTDLIKDLAPFTLSAAAVMIATHFVTRGFTSPWLLIISRCAMAGILYYGMMKVARVEILKECEQFVLKKIYKGK